MYVGTYYAKSRRFLKKNNKFFGLIYFSGRCNYDIHLGETTGSVVN